MEHAYSSVLLRGLIVMAASIPSASTTMDFSIHNNPQKEFLNYSPVEIIESLDRSREDARTTWADDWQEEALVILEEFYTKMLSNSRPPNPEAAKFLEDNLWDFA